MIRIENATYIPHAASDELFGANILAIRDTLDGNTGFERLYAASNATNLRYPGGSLTEDYFDIEFPDRSFAFEDDGSTRPFIPISEFFDFAISRSATVSIVLPTRNLLGAKFDQNGDRYPKIDEDSVRTFISSAITGEYGNAKISAFEIGNEYWGSGEMSSVEYGRVSSTLARIVDSEISKLPTNHQNFDTEIVVQSGANFNFASIDENYLDLDSSSDVLDALSQDYEYEFNEDQFLFSSGEVNWYKVGNQLVINEFTTDAERDAVDGVAVHLYSKEPKLPGTRDFSLDQIESSWAKEFNNVDIHVTEWNQSRSPALFDGSEDFGLYQAQELLNIVESYLENGIDHAQVWPLLQNTDNALARGIEFEEFTPAGQMFSWLAESIPNKVLLDLEPSDLSITEIVSPDASVHAFYGEDEMVFFIASKSNTEVSNIVDVSNVFEQLSNIDAEVLTVANLDEPGAYNAKAVVEKVSASEAFDNGHFVANLNPGEIMRITVRDFELTESFDNMIDEIDQFLDTGVAPAEAASTDQDQPEIAEANSVDDSSSSDFSWVLGALPLLILIAFA